MVICMICHSDIRPFADPAEVRTYDQYVLETKKRRFAICQENADAIFSFDL